MDWIRSMHSLTALFYRPSQPLSTVKRHIVILPEKAENEVGFPDLIRKVWNLVSNTGGKVLFYCNPQTQKKLKDFNEINRIEAQYQMFDSWEEFLILAREVRADDAIWAVLSRREHPSYDPHMAKVPGYLTKYFPSNSFVILFPAQPATGQDNRYFL